METPKLVLKKKSELSETTSDIKPEKVKFTRKSAVMDMTKSVILKDKKKNIVPVVDENFKIIPTPLINFSDFIPEKKEMFSLDSKYCQQAYDTICAMWNKDQKSRNFVKHLISAFVPYNNFARLFNISEGENTKCAILNHNVTGIREISEGLTKISMKKMFIDAHLITEEVPEGAEKRTKYNEDEIAEMDAIRKTVPIEIVEVRVGVMSDKSDKIIQVETNQALVMFATEMLLRCDELNFTIRKTRLQHAQSDVPKEKQLTKKEINQVVGRQTFGMDHKVDNKTFSKLLALKEELENVEK